jgi:hypothetical protein
LQRPTVVRAVVAILLGIEAAVFLYVGATWFPFYIAIAALIGGLLFVRTRGWVWMVMAPLAVICATLFVIPGGFLIAIGACGFLNSSCSNDEFLRGVAAFAAAAIVNIVAAALIVRTPPTPSKPLS